MKKSFRKIFSLCIVVVLASLGWVVYQQIRVKSVAAQQVQQLPAFSFMTLDSLPFTQHDLEGHPADQYIIQFFHPECEHCQYMAKTYQQENRPPGNYFILMVSQANVDALLEFQQTYFPRRMQQLQIVQDATASFPRIFGTGVVPSFFVYRQGKLVKKILGETTLSHLLQHE